VDDEARAAVRRTIAERCLYGVDLNPMAGQLARLSLWLAALAADRPLPLLDHPPPTGDSPPGAWIADPPSAPPRPPPPPTPAPAPAAARRHLAVAPPLRRVQRRRRGQGHAADSLLARVTERHHRSGARQRAGVRGHQQARCGAVAVEADRRCVVRRVARERCRA